MDWGSQDIEGNVTDATQMEKLRSVFDKQETREWEIKTPAGNTITYKAFISAFKYGEKTTDGLDSFSMTLRISGTVTFAAAGA